MEGLPDEAGQARMQVSIHVKKERLFMFSLGKLSCFDFLKWRGVSCELDPHLSEKVISARYLRSKICVQ